MKFSAVPILNLLADTTRRMAARAPQQKEAPDNRTGSTPRPLLLLLLRPMTVAARILARFYPNNTATSSFPRGLDYHVPRILRAFFGTAHHLRQTQPGALQQQKLSAQTAACGASFSRTPAVLLSLISAG